MAKKKAAPPAIVPESGSSSEIFEEDRPDVAPSAKFSLTLTRTQLKHLRDVLSVVASPDSTRTLSQTLAESEGRPISEAHLWSKIVDACDGAGLALGEDAPDFLIVMCKAPELTVMKVERDDDEEFDA